MSIYGYAIVDDQEHDEERQVEELRVAGVPVGNIFVDHSDGKSFERDAYLELQDTVMQGDTIFIHALDRMGRNFIDIQKQWEFLVKEKGVDIVALDMPLLDTRQAKDLLGTFVSDLVFQILSFAAQTEREAIKRRQREGIDAARERGVTLGRPKRILPEDFELMCRAVMLHGMTQSGAARILGIPLSTFRDRMKKYKEELGRRKD